MNVLESALGIYEATQDANEADCVIGHSFGTSIDENSVNRALADFIVTSANHRPVVIDEMLLNAFQDNTTPVAHTVKGPISNAVGKGVGTWGTLVEAKCYMNRQGLERALMIAQAHLIGRIMMQSRKLGIEAIAPPNLPSQFDLNSDQVWTRSLALWLPRELAGSVVLRLQGKL
ncbi:MAG TPA: hypothetical protein VFB03_01440 [Candidatus Saccharimonadales bacterium]|nr:hypothetical protein [Candidatus Saccharimonadales bacterium]